MTDREYDSWVNAHIAATGGDPARIAELLHANRKILTADWRATYAELCECSDRLVSAVRVPQFPSEHTNALLVELRAIRADQQQAKPRYGKCATCDGSGLATIPHPQCLVKDESGQWVIATAGNGRVMSCGVPCDRPGCVEGEEVRNADAAYRETKTRYKGSRVTTLDDYERRYGCDLVAMWREYIRWQTNHARHGVVPDTDWARLCVSLVTKARSRR